MLYVYVIKNKATGKIEAVARHMHQVLKILIGYEDIDSQYSAVINEEYLKGKMANSPSFDIQYANGEILVLENHAVEG